MLALSKRLSPLLPLLSRGRLFQTMPHQQQKVYDLQSDTATEPTDAMFDLMKSASRGDDVFAVRFYTPFFLYFKLKFFFVYAGRYNYQST